MPQVTHSQPPFLRVFSPAATHKKPIAPPVALLNMHAPDLDLDRRTTVAVQPGRALAARRRLFGTLEAAFPVTFVPIEGVDPAAEAVISFGDADDGPEPGRGRDLPRFVVADDAGSGEIEAVSLADAADVDRRVRGLDLPDRLDRGTIAPPDASTRVLAEAPSGPAWTLSEAAAPAHRVRSAPCPSWGRTDPPRPLPRAGPGDRQPSSTSCARSSAEPPSPSRRCAPPSSSTTRTCAGGPTDSSITSGCSPTADEHGYHASMAMVPLDGRLQHRATVDLFRRNPARLSLVFHGNNHLSQELMRPSDGPGSLALAAQAIRRAQRFESRYGLRMDRVMTPPHGMCSASTARALGAVGFDGLCAIHPLPWAERPPAERPLAGWDPAEFAADCAVIPRLHLESSDADVGLRAFLGQPLVFYGHHEDLAGGLDRLAEVAAQVRRLGDAHWCSLGEIAASNYGRRNEGGGVQRLRPYTSRLRLRPDAETRELLVEPPRDGDGRIAGWSLGDGPTTPPATPIPATPGADLELRMRRSDEVLAADVPASFLEPLAGAAQGRDGGARSHPAAARLTDARPTSSSFSAPSASPLAATRPSPPPPASRSRAPAATRTRPIPGCRRGRR